MKKIHRDPCGDTLANASELSPPEPESSFSRRFWQAMAIWAMTLLATAVIVWKLPNGFNAIWAGLAVTLVTLFWLVFPKAASAIGRWLFRFRWLAALVVFALLVAAQVHFSHVSAWAQIFPSDASVAESVLFGTARTIRSDEFNVQLPYYFSQAYNNFALISNQMSLSGQNMILGYNAPIMDWTLLFRPLLWGYLFLNNSYGLSWYFCGKVILMFMFALEMCWILTKKRGMAVFGGCLILLSPSIQWWLAPHIPDVFLWGMGLFVAGYQLLARTKWWQRILAGLFCIQMCLAFVMSLFPSLQVPCGLLMAALLAAVWFRDRRQIPFNRSLVLSIVAVGAISVAALVVILMSLKEGLTLLNATEYPGSRISLGGGYVWQQLFMNPAVIVYPYTNPTFLNSCELSTFIHYGPLCAALFPFLAGFSWKKKMSCAAGWVLFIALILEAVFMLHSFPEWFVKITLLSYCSRMDLAYGLTAAIFTVWTVARVRALYQAYRQPQIETTSLEQENAGEEQTEDETQKAPEVLAETAAAETENSGTVETAAAAQEESEVIVVEAPAEISTGDADAAQTEKAEIDTPETNIENANAENANAENANADAQQMQEDKDWDDLLKEQERKHQPEQKPKIAKAWYALAVIGLLLCAAYGWFFLDASLFDFARSWPEDTRALLAMVTALGLTAAVMFVFTSAPTLFFAPLFAFAAVSSLTVNPVSVTAAGVYDYPIAQQVREIVEQDPDALWLADSSLYTPSLLLANGARTVNAVNYYPDVEKWQAIDPSGKYWQQENRYANISVVLVDEPTSMEAVQADLLAVKLNPSDLKKWDIRYMAALKSSLPTLDKAGVEYEILFEEPDSQNVILQLK